MKVMHNSSTSDKYTKNTPIVSIIVPNYNYARFLDIRMESILNQTFQDFEIILLDDHSTDNSVEIIEKYRNNPKVSYIDINKENSGSPFRQWKKGIEYARGKYIWIAEADDSALPDFLEKTITALEATPSASVAFTGSETIDENGDPYGRDIDKWYKKSPQKTNGGWMAFNGKEYVVHNLYWHCYVYNASMTVFRKEYYSPDLLDDSIKMRNAGDWLFWIKITAKGDIIEVYEKLNLFRLHRKSATVAGIMSGNNVWEDIKVMKYVEDHFNVGKYRKAMRLGQYIKVLRRSKQYSPETRRKMMNAIRTSLGVGMGTFRMERINKMLSFIPFTLTQQKDRL